MARKPSAWFRERGAWYYTTHQGKQIKLSQDAASAEREFHSPLVALQRRKRRPFLTLRLRCHHQFLNRRDTVTPSASANAINRLTCRVRRLLFMVVAGFGLRWRWVPPHQGFIRLRGSTFRGGPESGVRVVSVVA